MERKHLALINSERKIKKVLSSKGCEYIDSCTVLDRAHICSQDYCGYDYSDCGKNAVDYCTNKDK